MKKIFYSNCFNAIICFTSLLVINSCGNSNDSKEKINSAEQKNNDCENIKDCLDQHDFERARVLCNNQGDGSDKLLIIAEESRFWLAEKEYVRAQKVAAEIFSLKIENVEKNNFYSETLNDIISAAVLDNNFKVAKEIESDFPIELKGDKTLSFRVDALKTIADGYNNSKQIKEKNEILVKLKEVNRKLLIAKTLFEKEKNDEIKNLENQIKELKLEKKLEVKKLEILLEKLEKKRDIEREKLTKVNDEWFLFQSDKDKAVAVQEGVFNEIDSEYKNIIQEKEDFNNSKIEAIQEKIVAIKNKLF